MVDVCVDEPPLRWEYASPSWGEAWFIRANKWDWESVASVVDPAIVLS
jgi:hypothetical protein